LWWREFLFWGYSKRQLLFKSANEGQENEGSFLPGSDIAVADEYKRKREKAWGGEGGRGWGEFFAWERRCCSLLQCPLHLLQLRLNKGGIGEPAERKLEVVLGFVP
jgi:hypothetical protein